MFLYNTLTRKKQKFVPIDDTVRIYSCGPTVYKIAHIGNLRTYIFMDLLRRVMLINGYKVLDCMNITDVGHLLSDEDTGEDKMVEEAKKQGKSPYEIAEFVTKIFFADLAKLNILMPKITPKATDHIAEMIEYVAALEKGGYAYTTPDGVYFDISKFADYGKLSGAKPESRKSGARVEVNEFKRNPADFALWKLAEPNHIMQWQSPWGVGFPGWHIECSVMSEKYLGEHFDIHTGGIDHVPIHHENEIAQSEAKNGHKTVNYWMHSEFMLCNNGRMGKSLGNGYTVDELVEKGYAPLDFRYFCLNANYRQKLNFTFEGMDAAKTAFQRLREQVEQHKNCQQTTDNNIISEYKQRFLEAINDDLNIPQALGVLWQLVKEPKSKDVYGLVLYMDKVFGLNLDQTVATGQTELPDEVTKLVEERKQARLNKDYAKSDELRNKIESLGYTVKDTKDGCEVTKA